MIVNKIKLDGLLQVVSNQQTMRVISGELLVEGTTDSLAAMLNSETLNMIVDGVECRENTLWVWIESQVVK